MPTEEWKEGRKEQHIDLLFISISLLSIIPSYFFLLKTILIRHMRDLEGSSPLKMPFVNFSPRVKTWSSVPFQNMRARNLITKRDIDSVSEIFNFYNFLINIQSNERLLYQT